jgi:hypothetical protein
MTTFAKKAIKYFSGLKSPANLPSGISVMNPYKNREVKKIVECFYSKFFNDTKERVYLFGINPGRFGGGLTGIAFTDPIALEQHCGIKNNFEKRPELSSRFVYSFIKEFGGAKKFYSKFFISALYPLALISNGKNYNYYDSRSLYKNLKPQLTDSVKKQISFGAGKDVVVCLGKKNAEYLQELNDGLCLFNNIIILEHPRYIMQYKLKRMDYYIRKYVDVLVSAQL